MAITGAQLVQDAMFQAGVLGQDGTTQPEGDADMQLVLRRLNRMLDSWSTERLIVYSLTQETLALVAGTAQYSSSSLTQRPVQVVSMSVSYGGVDYPINFIDEQQYTDIGLKTIAAIPQMCWINMTYPNATFTFFPVPYAPMTANLISRRVLQGTAVTMATSLAFPPGYEKAFVDCLALDICPSFGVQPSDAVVASAKEAKAALKRLNVVPAEMTTDFDRDNSYALANICYPW